jgi:dihydrofolate reductase
MRKLIVFNHVTLDGYFAGTNGDFSWARLGNDDPEYQAWVTENSQGESQLLFGRKTYDLMSGYWPTPMANQHDPIVAKRMNALPKVVFSTTLDQALWNNTTLIKGNIVEEIKKMKNEPGPGMLIFGSGSIIAQLAPEHLIDEYQMVIDPVALGKGKTMFEGMQQLLSLKLTKTRIFNNGKIFLSYQA